MKKNKAPKLQGAETEVPSSEGAQRYFVGSGHRRKGPTHCTMRAWNGRSLECAGRHRVVSEHAKCEYAKKKTG